MSAFSSEKNHNEVQELIERTQDEVRLERLYKQEEDRQDKILQERFSALKGHAKIPTDAELQKRLNNLKEPIPTRVTKPRVSQIINPVKRNLILAYKDLSSIVKTASAREKLKPIFARTSLLVRQSNQLQKQKNNLEAKMLGLKSHQAIHDLITQLHRLDAQIQDHNHKMSEFSQKLKAQAEKFRHMQKPSHNRDQSISPPRISR